MVRVDPVDPKRSDGKRLDGWKSIAAYFNRERTTVMRWARERNLPVHRIPGGKQGSVFAFERELADWARRHEDGADAEPRPPGSLAPPNFIPAPGYTISSFRSLRLSRLVVGFAAAALLITGSWGLREARRPDRPGRAATSFALPGDPAVARDYVAARDLWARRTPRDLTDAIRLYEGVIRRDPGFAPAHAGLAEAWLITREYGEVDEPTAYRRARRHAEQAMRLAPDLPSAHRALGFIDYWWSGRAANALAHFRRAITLDDHDAQTHFWYANLLADLGDDPAAQREYDKARLLSPGSRIIEVEQACSHWQAGRDEVALEQLTALAQRAPDDATIHNCLAWAHISRGDITGYARALSSRARLRREPQLLRLSAALDEAVRRDPGSAVRVLIEDGRREIASGARKLRDTPAFYASAMGDRAALVQLMTEAGDLGEQWYSAPVTRRIADRWRGDAEIRRLLAALIPPPVNLHENS